MPPSLIEADSDAGFQFPYFLHIPDADTAHDDPAILVEPTNIEAPTDAFDSVLETAEVRATSGFGRRVADELGVPLLHPVFPRPQSGTVDWRVYTHSLDRETLAVCDHPLERIDHQLLAMADDAAARLAEAGIEVRDELLLNGFSASGTFANRFTALHPDRVCSVSAGGINGMAILPQSSAQLPHVGEHPLEYPVGVADLEALTGEAFDHEAFAATNQLLYLGTEDDRDTLLYPDAWTGVEIRLTAILTYGEDIHDERFPACQAAYEAAGVNAAFILYPDTGHEPLPALDDIVALHRHSLEGSDFETIREAIQGKRLTSV